MRGQGTRALFVLLRNRIGSSSFVFLLPFAMLFVFCLSGQEVFEKLSMVVGTMGRSQVCSVCFEGAHGINDVNFVSILNGSFLKATCLET